MLQLDNGLFINIEMIESMWTESSVFFIKMASGAVHVISPFQFNEIIRLKHSMDEISGQGFAG